MMKGEGKKKLEKKVEEWKNKIAEEKKEEPIINKEEVNKKEKMEIKLTGKKIFWGIVIIIVLVAVGLWAWTEVASSKDPNGASPYSAVYLTSGDIYFGKLSWFPQPHLTDVWYLQRSTDASGKAQVAVAPLKSVFWGPIDEVTLNQSQILFTTRLSNSSQLVSGFENPQSLTQGAPSSTTQNPSGTPSTEIPATSTPTK